VPLFECYIPKGLLNDSAKAGIAAEITAIHTTATGAPDSFINVMFREYSQGDCFLARKPAGSPLIRFGTIRHGRSLEPPGRCCATTGKMWVRITGQSEADLLVILSEAVLPTPWRLAPGWRNWG
jgi:phenylpyruvate tautomerase PptA (4-oxalocrotonate tautomerase family)